ncbi:MAG: ABC transporter permease [Candidatus Pacearchaeota archaeon]|jgi:putative ABC transport system permease protein
MIKDYFVLSVKNLKHRGLRSWLTLLGILIGVGAVVALISLGDGLQAAVASQFGVSSTDLITVQAGGINYGPPGSGAVIPLTTDDLTQIKNLPSVKAAIGRDIVPVKASFNQKLVFTYATNIPSGSDRQFVYSQINAQAISGRLLKDGDIGKIVIGYNFYTDSNGFGKAVIPGNTIVIQNKSFQVVGILARQGSFIFDNVIYMNQNDLDSISNYGNKIDTIAIEPASKDLMNRTVSDVENLLLRLRNVKKDAENFQISTPEASLNQVKQIINGVQIFIAIVASISIFIGAIGIVNTMYTSVLERRKDIGIMKSIGATNFQIFIQFFIESSLLGLVGGIIGIIFGEFIAIFGIIGINSLIGGHLPITINLGLIFGVLIGSFLIGGAAGIVPALNAANQNPVEVLRDE